METASYADEDVRFNVVRSGFMLKVFYVFAALALLSAGISIAGKWLGGSIAMAGHTDDRTTRKVVIGGNMIVAPANAIRFERQRMSGAAARLDLYFHWPDMEGYSREAADAFNHADGRGTIVFASLEPRMMSRDMSGRFEPIYRELISAPPVPGPNGVSLYRLAEKSGYLNEELAVARRDGREPYVARCLTGPGAGESLAPCERDIHVGEDLSLTYRFPRELLAEWQRLDTAVIAKAAEMLKG